MSDIAKVKEVAFGALDSVSDPHITAALTEAAKHYDSTVLTDVYAEVVALHAAHLLSLPGGPGGTGARVVQGVSIGRGTASKTYATGGAKSGNASDLSSTSYGQRAQALLATVITTPIALYT